MKNAKFFVMVLVAGLFTLTMNSCKKCKGEAPRARIINNGTQKASVQIQTSGGNTVNINNIEVGSTSDYSSYAAGQVTFTVKISNVDYVKIVDMSTCYDYDIAIDASNNITSVPTDRND